MTEQGGLTRRGILGVGAGAALTGAFTGVAGTYAARRAAAAPSPADRYDPAAPVPFHGAHQAGITTPAQDRMHFVALDVTTDDREQLVKTLKAWTRAAERMTAGAEAAPGGVVGGGPYGVPEDTGEAYDLEASGLTITIGFGPSLFDDRFGLADRRPEGFEDLPAFRGDDLDPARCGGDIGIQACANDPQVAVHAIRNLVRIGFGTVSVRWSQLGFGRTSSTSTSQVTARNMFGFKDGTNNLKAEDPEALAEHVWVQPGDVPGKAAWMAGGSYLVARRIRMHIEVWDRTNLQEQEQVIGRTKGVGAPLGQRQEFDTVDLAAKGTDGHPPSPRPRTSGSRRRRPSRGSGCCGAATTSPTAPTASDTSTPACSSSPSAGTSPSSSCRCSGRWRPRTPSTSTSSTTARRSSPVRQGSGPAGTGARRSSAEGRRPSSRGRSRCRLSRDRWRYQP